MAKDTDRVVTLDEVDAKAVPAAKATSDAPTVAAKEIAGKNHDAALCGDKVTVTFFEQDGDLGKLPVPIGLNGYTYQVPRGVPCSIPVEALEVIKNSVEDVYEANGSNVTRRARPRFSFQVHA